MAVALVLDPGVARFGLGLSPGLSTWVRPGSEFELG